MDDGPDLERISRAWRLADDDDVVRARKNRADFAPEVYAVIEDEARRRDLPDDAAVPTPHRPGAALDTWLKTVLTAVHAHRVWSALAWGVCLRILVVPLNSFAQDVSPLIWGIVHLSVLAAGTMFICWPLRTYRSALLTATMASAGTVCTALTVTGLRPGASVMAPSTLVFLALAVAAVGSLALAGILCVTVWARNRYWPVYPPGHCLGCGYSLRGLPVPRCPECGRAFELEDVPSPVQ